MEPEGLFLIFLNGELTQVSCLHCAPEARRSAGSRPSPLPSAAAPRQTPIPCGTAAGPSPPAERGRRPSSRLALTPGRAAGLPLPARTDRRTDGRTDALSPRRDLAKFATHRPGFYTPWRPASPCCCSLPRAGSSPPRQEPAGPGRAERGQPSCLPRLPARSARGTPPVPRSQEV